jgi:hypothetical protein
MKYTHVLHADILQEEERYLVKRSVELKIIGLNVSFKYFRFISKIRYY